MSPSFSLHLTAIFPRAPGLAGTRTVRKLFFNQNSSKTQIHICGPHTASFSNVRSKFMSFHDHDSKFPDPVKCQYTPHLVTETNMAIEMLPIITLCTSCSAVYCNRSCLWVCGCVCLFVGLLPRLLEIVCIDPHQTGFVGKGSDHLQLIKFWPSCTPGKGVCGKAKIFGSTLLQPACSVCVSS